LSGYGVYRHFQQYFSYIVAVSFIGGGNQSTRRKPPTCRKSLTNFYHIMLYRVHLAWSAFELTTLVVIAKGAVKKRQKKMVKKTATIEKSWSMFHL